jgi:hypothetical protein
MPADRCPPVFPSTLLVHGRVTMQPFSSLEVKLDDKCVSCSWPCKHDSMEK